MSDSKIIAHHSPLATFFRCLFFGEDVLESVHSPYNGTLKVNRDIFGHIGIIGGGISQSGGMTDNIYKKAIVNLQKKIPNLEKVLILGYGAGTFDHLLRQVYPGVRITGVDVDEKIVGLGQKYLGDTSSLTQIVIQSADQYLAENTNQYDLVFVDMYQGQQVPEFANSDSFFDNLKKSLTPHGLILFNRLNWSRHKHLTRDYLILLRRHFGNIRLIETAFNLLIFAGI